MQEWEGDLKRVPTISPSKGQAVKLHDARHLSHTYPAQMALDMQTTYISSHPQVPKSAPNSKIYIL